MRLLHRASLFFCIFAALLYVAGIQGVPLRILVSALELEAPSVPETVTGREGLLDVIVVASDGDKAPLRAHVRAFAILDGKAFAAGAAATDETGRATLKDLPQGEHWVVAEAEGRARASRMVVVVAGARRLDLELGPEHFVDVVTKTEDGTPVPDAEIEVRGSDPFPVGARTDAEGKARVGRLGEGPFSVTARAIGYQETTKRRVGETGGPVALTLVKQGTLVVKVVGEDGAPVPSARVLVTSPSLWPARVGETGKDGAVRIAGLDAGTYSLRAVAGMRVSPIEVGVALARGEGKEIELRLGPGASVAVHVVDGASDDDVRDAKVTLVEGGLSSFPLEAVTDKNGRAVLGPFARGASTLSVRADGFVAKAAIPIAEIPPPELRVVLLKGGVLVGKISDGRGYAVDGATIRVLGTDLEGMPVDEDPQRTSFQNTLFVAALKGPSPLVPAGELGVMPGPVPPIPHGPSATFGLGAAPNAARGAGSDARAEPWVSGRDGTYRAMPVTPGRVRIQVTHPQYVEAMSELVSLAPEKEARIDLVLHRGGTLDGRVVDGKHRGVPHAHVNVLSTRGSLERSVRAGDDGSFAFASVPDAVIVLVSREEDMNVVAARMEVSVPENGRRTVEIVLPDPREALPVHVTGDRGAPVDAAQITAMSIDPNEALRATAFTDARGEAALSGAKGLSLRVEIRAAGRAARVVTTTAETSRLDVVLSAAEKVTGEVTGRRRDPIEGAEVVLHTETGLRVSRTGRDGTFTIGDVPAGPARLRVRAPGFAPSSREVTVDDRGGQRATELPRVELAEEGIVEGVVVDEHGDAVPGARVGKDGVPTYLPVNGKTSGVAVADARGRFKLSELAEGTVTLEAYAADVGRARVTDVRVRGGRTTDGVKIVLQHGEKAVEPHAAGGVAITLGETAAGLDAAEVVIVSVSEGSEAERAGLLAGDIVLDVGGAHVTTMADARARLAGPIHDDVVVKVRRGGRVVALRVAREQVRR